MSNKVNRDAPVFPNSDELYGGLTKREYFAAMALQGLVASDSAREWTESSHAWAATSLADALIEELNK